MVEVSFPHAGYHGGAVTEEEYARTVGWGTPDGVIGTPSDSAPLFLSGGALFVRVGSAARMVGMAYEVQDANLPVAIANNSAGSTRLDHVVLRLTWATMQVRTAVKQGVPGGPLPGLTRQRGSGVFEMSWGRVSVPAGGTVATAAITRLCWYLGPRGQTICTPDTRPPHEPGLRIFETTNARELMSNGTKWLVSTERTDKQTLPLASGWAAPSYNSLRRVNGWVYLAITLQRTGGAVAASTAVTFGTLPVGYRPDEAFESLANAPSSGDARISVATNGACQVTCYGGLNTSRFVNLDPLRFPAAAI